MKVKDLKKILEQMNEDADIYVNSDQWGCPVAVSDDFDLMLDKDKGELLILLINMDGF